MRSSIRALRTDDQVPSPITDLQAAVDDAIAALDRLERAVKVRPGDDPRLIGLVRGAKDAVRAVRDRNQVALDLGEQREEGGHDLGLDVALGSRQT